jgi:hypothetical protein
VVDVAGITQLSMQSKRWPLKHGFVFEPHRLALSAWGLALRELEPGPPAVLVTLDRHFDLVAPRDPPAPGAAPAALDEWARTKADLRNVDQVLAGCHAGLLTDVIAFGRAKPSGAIDAESWQSPNGSHRIIRATRVANLATDYGLASAPPPAHSAQTVLQRAARVVLDVDLDCFTTPSDADPTSVVPWRKQEIQEFLLPRGSSAFWSAVLSKCVAVTVAREPAHCGGLAAEAALFLEAAPVLFEELLSADLP